MAKKRKGMGNIITIRRMRGLGRLNDPKSLMGAALPPLAGAGLVALVTAAARYWAKPSEGDTPKAVFKWAPAIGLGVSSVFSLAMYYLSGAPGAISTFVSGLATSGGIMLHDQVVRNAIGEYSLALPPNMTGNAGGAEGTVSGMRRLGLVVGERVLGPGGRSVQGTRGIVYEDPNSRDPRVRYGVNGVASYGETARVAGVNPQAFGTPGFGGR